MSLGTRAPGTLGPARDRLLDSGGEGRALRASSAAAHGSGQPSWATPGPGKGAAAISVPGEVPPGITLPYSSAPPLAPASCNPRCSGAPSSSGAFSGESSRVPGRRGGWPRSLLALLVPGPSCWNLCGQPGVRSHLVRLVPGPRAPAGGTRHPHVQSRLPAPPRSARGSSVLARPGEPRPRLSGAHGRALQPERSRKRAGASETPVIPEALAPRSFGSAAEPAAADVRRRLPSPGWVWEAERRAQRELGAARRGKDSGGGGGAVARRSRLLKGTPPAVSLPAEDEHLPLGGAARRGSPSGRERRAGVWTARRGSRGGVGPRAGTRGRRGGRSRLQPLTSKGLAAEAPDPRWRSGVKSGTNTGLSPHFPTRPVIQLSV